MCRWCRGGLFLQIAFFGTFFLFALFASYHSNNKTKHIISQQLSLLIKPNTETTYLQITSKMQFISLISVLAFAAMSVSALPVADEGESVKVRMTYDKHK